MKIDHTNYYSHKEFALRMCTRSWDSDYEQLLVATNLESLEYRRSQASLCHLFKIVRGTTEFVDAPVTRRVFSYNSRSSAKQVLCMPRPKTTSYQHSFFPKTINRWNKLPEEVTNCTSIDSFKKLLKSVEL